ncbi:MAG: carbon-nitrogen hydrolase family protein [Nitrososphaerales archaeon]
MITDSAFKISCAQIDCKLGNVKSNLAQIENVAREISRKSHPDIICFPELATTGYYLGRRWSTLAEEVPGKSTDELARIASESGSYLICGVDEKDKTGRIYDSAVLIDPNGRIIGKYRKVHLWDKERDFFTSGDSFPVFKTKFCTLGMGICYDLEFPESARTLAKKGAQLIVFPSAELSEVQKQVDSYILSRAAENCVFVAFSNRVGRESRNITFFGHSQIASPDARVVMANRQDRNVSAKIDLKLLNRMRKKLLPYLDQLESRAYA